MGRVEIGRPGRTQSKLIQLLEDQGFCDINLRPARGAWRTNKRLDVSCWEGDAVFAPLGIHFTLYSFSTMTKCVRHGITVTMDGPTFTIESKMPG